MPNKKTPDPSITWAEPPPKGRTGPRGGGRAQNFVEALKAKPGRWAVYTEEASSAAPRAYLTKRGADAVSRRNEDGTFTIYARWPEA